MVFLTYEISKATKGIGLAISCAPSAASQFHSDKNKKNDTRLRERLNYVLTHKSENQNEDYLCTSAGDVIHEREQVESGGELRGHEREVVGMRRVAGVACARMQRETTTGTRQR
ncbi:hypothetical protein R1flu_023112 [Riccia fluitans]|uniref:Uncharacterized protein n=1 Tax=Riccia fluitans TaxID=41844 RepID=A0ABD1XR38_9MARC